MFSSRRLSSSLNFSFLPGSRSSAPSPPAPDIQRNRPTPPMSVQFSHMSPRSPTRPAADHAQPAPADRSVDDGDLTITLIPQPSLNSSHPSLSFSRIKRTLSSPRAVLRIGRYSDQRAAREESAAAAAVNAISPSTAEPVGTNSMGSIAADGVVSSLTPLSANADPVFDCPIGFKSKVVSRRHCEIWYQDSEWFIKDVKSSSGTFVNNFRLSGPKAESRPHRIRSGDIIQLGIDFRGGQEEVFRCVKMTVILGKNGQPKVTDYNRSTLKSLTGASNAASDVCSICLCKISPCQALFMAPCSHVWHYKCILRLLSGPTSPSFLCPNCRTVSALDADIEDDPEEEDAPVEGLTSPGESESVPSPEPFPLVDQASASPPADDSFVMGGTSQAAGAGPLSDCAEEDEVASTGPLSPDMERRTAALSMSNQPTGVMTPMSVMADQPAESGSDSDQAQPSAPDSQTGVSPKLGPITPPRLSFLDADTAAAAIMAVSGGDFPTSITMTSSNPLTATPSEPDGRLDRLDGAFVATPPNTVGPYLPHQLSVLSESGQNSREAARASSQSSSGQNVK